MDLFALISPANFATAIIVMNFITFAAFGIDKARAEQGQWRISEATLLQLAFFGGTVGAYAGRALFRHKTKKQPFSDKLWVVAFLQVVGVTVLTVYILFGDKLAWLFDR